MPTSQSMVQTKSLKHLPLIFLDPNPSDCLTPTIHFNRLSHHGSNLQQAKQQCTLLEASCQLSNEVFDLSKYSDLYVVQQFSEYSLSYHTHTRLFCPYASIFQQILSVTIVYKQILHSFHSICHFYCSRIYSRLISLTPYSNRFFPFTPYHHRMQYLSRLKYFDNSSQKSPFVSKNAASQCSGAMYTETTQSASVAF